MDPYQIVESEVRTRHDPLLEQAWREAISADALDPNGRARFQVFDWIVQGTWGRERKRRLRARELELAATPPSQRPHARSRAIGRRVRSERVLAGLSLRAFAAATGMSLHALTRVERGARKLTLEEACWIADVLELPLAALRPPASAAREPGE